MQLKLIALADIYHVHRLPSRTDIPLDLFENEGIISITKTEEEISILCPSNVSLPESKKEGPWNLLKVKGPLDFTLTGILADLLTPLKESRVSIFALSTFDTDYILVKAEKFQEAKKALLAAGYEVLNLPQD